MNITAELKVIDRISKLLALAASPNEHEAARAAEKAQELMAEYNITLASVEANGGVSGQEGVRERREKTHRTVYKWQHELMDAVGAVNYCAVRRKYKRSEKNWRQQVFEGFEIIGRKANVVSTETTFDYLFTAIERLARDWAAANVDPARPGTSNLYSATACRFREGCADRLTARLNAKHRSLLADQQRKEREQREQRATQAHPSAAPSTENALVVFSDYIQMEDDLNNDFLWNWEPGTTARRRAEYEAQLNSPEAEARRAAWQELAGETPPETAKERARRERASQRWWDSYSRRQARDAERKARPGYQDGQRAGEQIGLDLQLDRSTMRRVK